MRIVEYPPGVRWRLEKPTRGFPFACGTQLTDSGEDARDEDGWLIIDTFFIGKVRPQQKARHDSPTL